MYRCSEKIYVIQKDTVYASETYYLTESCADVEKAILFEINWHVKNTMRSVTLKSYTT
jgi:hypothetical protein